LSAGNANGAAGRPKSPSPLAAAANDAENALPAPTAIRTTSASAIRKGPTATGAKRTNILGAKKPQKLGAKKVVGEEIDFDAAEKAAKAEAERIEKLGYDPEAEKEEELSKNKSSGLSTKETPAPATTPKAGVSNPNTHKKSPSEVERLGMGVARLGFGQIGASKSAVSSAPAPKKLGFGSVGASKAATDGKTWTFLEP
jgi:ADP-ribosylation factor GTPase-activating protein 2/3